MRNEPINVLVVDGSPLMREWLGRILSADPGIRVGGYARHGLEALAQLQAWRPDVITMDIHLPGMDGYEVTRRIMETRPVPIVIVSASHQAEDLTQSFRALEAGAVAAIEKPPGPGTVGYELRARKLVQMVKAMAEVRVVRRWAHARSAPPAEPAVSAVLRRSGRPLRLVAMGASTGGPPVLRTILAHLPKPFPAPVLIVQHISSGFVAGLAEWLESEVGMPVSVAQDCEIALPGHAYLAPDGCQMLLASPERIGCPAGSPENGLRPAICCLFRSVAREFRDEAAGVLLSGMGRDGAQGLKLMREQGALTLVQDAASAVVYGMPGAALQLGAATQILAPEQIAEMLGNAVRNGLSA